MSENAFTIYQHPKTTKEGPCYRWYYYYYDLNGKKIQKALNDPKYTDDGSYSYLQDKYNKSFLKKSNK